MEKDSHTDGDIKKILLDYKRVCVVGVSDTPGKAAHEIPKYLLEKGYTIIPINPNHDTVLGLKAFRNIEDVDTDFDILDIFRPSEEVLGIVEDVLKKPPKVIWMQEGIKNDGAREMAEKEGVTVVFNRCMMKEHYRLFGS
jgi:hypothetical protein